VRVRETLDAAQSNALKTWSATLSRNLTHVPAGDVLIHDARLFDPRDLSVTAHTSVLIRQGHIIRVIPDGEIQPAANAEYIDAHGQFLMTGLWDNPTSGTPPTSAPTGKQPASY
jgi:hypothetical protein